MSGKETSESQNIFSFGGQEHQVAGILHPFILNPFAPWDFAFRFLSSPLVSLFLPHVFSFAGHLVGFILVGKALRKAFRILGLGERKGRWVVEQDFHGNFRVKITWFLMPFLQCPWLNCAYSGMVLKLSSLCTH